MKNKWKKYLLLIILALTVGIAGGYVVSQQQTIRVLKSRRLSLTKRVVIKDDETGKIYK